MELDKINIADINPSSYNPRHISDSNIEKLKKSINSFGFVDPIIINLKNNRIIGGHQRYKVLLEEHENNKELNLFKIGDIGWVFPNDNLKIENEEQEKALNINLNQTNLMGEWDNEKLKELFTDLNNVDFDLELTGFDDFEIDLFLDDDYEVFEYQHVIDETEKEEDEPKNDEEIKEETEIGYSDVYEEKPEGIVEEQPVADNTEKRGNNNNDTEEAESLNDKPIKTEVVDVADIIPDDYVEVKGDNANKSYVVSIGFDTHETANQFLQYIGYHRLMNRDTLQFMWTELNINIKDLLNEKIKNQKEQEELENTQTQAIWEYYKL